VVLLSKTRLIAERYAGCWRPRIFGASVEALDRHEEMELFVFRLATRPRFVPPASSPVARGAPVDCSPERNMDVEQLEGGQPQGDAEVMRDGRWASGETDAGRGVAAVWGLL